MDWTRKNPFIRFLREKLKRFRITDSSFDMADEMTPASAVQGEPLEEWKHTGWQVITIKLFGYWRAKEKPELPPEEVSAGAELEIKNDPRLERTVEVP